MANYDNLAKDFSVSLIDDATPAASPVNATPRFATHVVASFASLEHQVPHDSWVEYRPAAWKGVEMIRPCSYVETFDDGPGRLVRLVRQRPRAAAARTEGRRRHPRVAPGGSTTTTHRRGRAILHLLYMLLTRGAQGEHLNEVAGPNRFVRAGYPTDFRNARLSAKVRDLTPRHHNLDSSVIRKLNLGHSGHGELLRHPRFSQRR